MSNTDEEIAGKIPVETDNKVLADVTQITRPSANMENGLVSVTGCMAVNVANVNSKHQLAQNNRRNGVLAKEPDYIIEMSSMLTRRCTTLGKNFHCISTSEATVLINTTTSWSSAKCTWGIAADRLVIARRRSGSVHRLRITRPQTVCGR